MLLRRFTLAFGVLILVLSACPIFLMVRELVVARYVVKRYEATWLHGPRQTVFHGHAVRLSDPFKAKDRKPEDREIGVVRITLDGRDYTYPTPVEVRPTEWDANRYWMEVMIVHLLDRKTKKESLVVLQRIPSIIDLGNYDLDSLRCRALYLSPNGHVREEIFRFGDRAHPPYRALLAASVAPEGLGITSQVMWWFWPSLLWPILYPFISGLVGLWLTLAGFAHERRRSREAAQPT